jgi:hypothetical protein
VFKATAGALKNIDIQATFGHTLADDGVELVPRNWDETMGTERWIGSTKIRSIISFDVG